MSTTPTPDTARERFEAAHPMQPIVVDACGVTRFRANGLINHLVDIGRINLNETATLGFPEADHRQLAQLIGYSIDGYSTLPYVDDEAYDEAAQAALAQTAPDAAQPEAAVMPEAVAWMQIGLEGSNYPGSKIPRKQLPAKWNPEWWRFEALYSEPEVRRLVDALARKSLLEEVGRLMVELTTTVWHEDEWLAIPELWKRCQQERDEQRARADAAESALSVEEGMRKESDAHARHLESALAAEREKYREVYNAFKAVQAKRIAAERRAQELEAMLLDALEFIENQEDVIDGSDGEPQANRAMQLAQAMRALDPGAPK